MPSCYFQFTVPFSNVDFVQIKHKDSGTPASCHASNAWIQSYPCIVSGTRILYLMKGNYSRISETTTYSVISEVKFINQ